MAVFYEDTYLVDSRDVDLFGHCKPSGMLGILQEAAGQAAATIGLTHEASRRNYNAFWMLTRIRYELYRPIVWNEKVTIRTWHRGARAVMTYREFDILVGEELVGRALSIWVLAGWEERKLVKLTGLRELTGTDGGERCRTDTLHKPKAPAELTPAGKRKLGYSDTDMNTHINNVHYADYASDALELEVRGRGKFVSALQVDYVAECMPGDVLEHFIGRTETGDWYVTGRDSEGVERFDALMTLTDLPTK